MMPKCFTRKICLYTTRYNLKRVINIRFYKMSPAYKILSFCACNVFNRNISIADDDT